MNTSRRKLNPSGALTSYKTYLNNIKYNSYKLICNSKFCKYFILLPKIGLSCTKPQLLYIYSSLACILVGWKMLDFSNIEESTDTQPQSLITQNVQYTP